MESLREFGQNFLSFLVTWQDAIVLVAILILYVFSLLAAAHILLTKRDPRASLGWIVICLGFPGLGVLGYLLFGINRVKTRGQDWTSSGLWDLNISSASPHPDNTKIPLELASNPTFLQIKNVADTITAKPVVCGCDVKPLYNGEEAYPAMIAEIQNAKKSVYLVTYIFQTDGIGKEFVKALADAKARGVDVRVIIDGIGNFFSIPRVSTLLKKHKVPVEKFLPLSLIKGSLHLNLRNHRKILVVDGKTGFTGGMNLRDRHIVSKEKKENRRVADIHFKVTGPVVGQLQDTFLVDWFFLTGKKPDSPITYDNTPTGKALCRGISDAPDKNFEKIRLTIMGAITAAQKHIRIITPYFIPDSSLISALNAAALKGVKVEILLPEKNNLNYVKWASQAFFCELLVHGIDIYYQPSPFSHTKLMMIDDFYVMLGSANLDPRSLRLNFEFNLEVFDYDFSATLCENFDKRKALSRQITHEYNESRSILSKLRDGFFKLFSPYI